MSTVGNMDLTLPVVSNTVGPEYATLINDALTRVSNHNHTTGQGAAIPVSGLNINSDLPLGNNSLTQAKAVYYNDQAVSVVTLTTSYFFNGDYYVVDGQGNQVRMTQNGAVAGSPGSIANLVSPASASYVALSSKYVWQSDTNTAADLDFRSAILRNAGASSFGLTLSPPSAMAADISQTLPTVPASTKIMQMNSSGVMSTVLTTDNASLEITSSASFQVLNVKAYGITKIMLAALGQVFSASCGAFSTSSASYVDVTNLSVPLTTSGRPVFIGIMSDGTGALSKVSSPAGSFAIINIKRDVTELSDCQSGSSASDVVSPVSMWIIDTPAAGSYTYKVQLKSTGGGIVTLNQVKLAAYEL